MLVERSEGKRSRKSRELMKNASAGGKQLEIKNMDGVITLSKSNQLFI